MLHSISDSLAIARELLKQILINLVKLGAAQLADRVEKTQEQVRLGCRRQLIGKAAEIVALEEVGGVEDTACQVGDVDAREAVGGSEITANVKELRVQGSGVEDICVEVVEFVRVCDRTLVPVLGNSFMALVGSIAAGLSIDSEPALDDVVAELSRRRLLTVVGHEAVDEGVCCGLHQDTGEWAVKEVRVGLLLGVETLSTEGGQRLHRDEATG